MGEKRCGDDRHRRKRTNVSTVFFAIEEIAQYIFIDLGMQLRLNWSVRNSKSWPAILIAVGQAWLLSRIIVCDCDSPHHSIVTSHIENAKVREPRDDRANEGLECLLVIERRRENIARLSKEFEPLLLRLGFSACDLFADKLRAFLRLSFDLLSLLKKLDENAYLCPQNFRHDWCENVIHCTQRIAAGHVIQGVAYRADENDRRCFRTGPLSNHGRGLKSIHSRHIHVE